VRILRQVLAFAVLCAGASATTYYVDPAGSNANSGLSPQTPWRTLLKVGISSFQPGDVILFKRDGVWNEWLTPPSSGTAGNLIKFDAYGNGRPPKFTGRYLTTSSQWSNTSGNVWQITLTATQAISQLKFVQFGSIWGNAQTSQVALTHNRDWYYDTVNQILYVYSSAGNPVNTYGSITPIILSGQSLININNVSYIQVQHIKLDWYDGYGVQVQGASDHIWLANMLADSQVPNGTVPLGFYVHPTGTPGDIHLYNTDAHRNYVGYRFDGTPTTIELKNCRAYANRTYGLMEVHYRGQRGSASLMTSGRAFARVTNPASIASLQHGIDNGTRSSVRHIKFPPARTSADCENAALAILSDGATAGWTGKYKVWSDFLPGGALDIFPGDGLYVNVPSCSAIFQATVREVEVRFTDLAGEHSLYEIQFADDAAKTLSFEFETAKVATPINIPQITNAQVGSTVLPDLTSAQITAVASTTASIDAGITPPSGGGIEVRWSDSNWGPNNDETLAGRFTTQTFTLPRLTKVQSYFLRQYDASSPPRYSRHSAALHVDYPY
jgi:hypothetical protein